MFSNMLEPSFHSDFLTPCRQVISLYFPEAATATIVPLTETGGFSGAVISRIELGGRSFCLRRWPAAAPEPKRLAGLHRLLAHTFRMGISQIAVPLKSRSGSTLVWVDEHWWQLEPWLPGQSDFHAQPARIRLQHSMQVLARWHVAARQFVPNDTDRMWFTAHNAAASPGMTERWNALTHWQNSGEILLQQRLRSYPDPELQQLLSQIWSHFQSLAPMISHNLAQVLTAEVPLQPCLRDIWHDHLLFSGDELTGLIDPSACRTENIATDLARLLGSLLEDQRAEWDFALDCYQQVRPLSLSELQLLPAFDESGVLLSGITWLDWLLVQQRRFANRGQVVSRLEAVQRRLAHLRKRS